MKCLPTLYWVLVFISRREKLRCDDHDEKGLHSVWIFEGVGWWLGRHICPRHSYWFIGDVMTRKSWAQHFIKLLCPRRATIFYRALLLKLLAPPLAYWKQPRNLDITVHHERGRTILSVKTKKRRGSPNYARSARQRAEGNSVHERFHGQMGCCRRRS